MFRWTAVSFTVAWIAAIFAFSAERTASDNASLITMVMALVAGVLFLVLGLMDDDL